MAKKFREGATKKILAAGVLLSLGYGIIAHAVQSYNRRAEEVLSNLIRERQSIGFVHEERPKLEVRSGFLGGAYHSAENDNSKIILVNSSLLSLFESPKLRLSHEAGHAYVSERLKKLNPVWYEKYKGMQFPDISDTSLSLNKRVSLYWNHITKTDGLEDLVSFQVVNEGIAMYFVLREVIYGYDGFTKRDDYRRKFATADCIKHTKNFPRDLSIVCATDLGQTLVTPLIDKHGPKAIDAILLNLPSINELRANGRQYQERVESTLNSQKSY